MAETPLTERDLLTALATKHGGDAWAFFTHVRNCTGYSRRVREADALAMSLWPSRGLELHGFEVKVSRSDWLRELKEPEKTEHSLFQYCDRWWIVVPPDVVKTDELPPTWGLLVLGKRWACVKPAPQLEPVAVDRKFLASLLRRLHQAELEPAAIAAAHERGRKEGASARDYEAQSNKRQLDQLRASLKVFEDKSGLQIAEWNGEQLGDAVRQVLAGNHLHYRRQLEGLKDVARRVGERIEQELAVVPG